MKLKKILAILLALALVLMMGQSVIFAEDAAAPVAESAEGESAEGESAESEGDAAAPAEEAAAPEGESAEGESAESEGDAAAPAEEAAAPEGESAEGAEGESAAEGGEGESAAEGAEGGDSAGGESAGGDSSGAAPAEESGPSIVQLEKEDMDELIIGAEGYEFTTDLHVGKLEIDPAAEITSQYPIIVFFDESESVENGTIIGNVQFVSDYDEVVAIVHTNDVHGHIEVEPYVKGLADELKASGEYSLVLTISAGDVYSGGEAVAGSYKGELIPAIVDKVYDVIVPGNNDVGPIGAIQEVFLTHLYDHTVVLCANGEVSEEGMPLADYGDAYEAKAGNELFDALYDKVALDAEGNLDLSAMGLENLEPGTPTHQHTMTVTTDKGTVIGLFGLTTSAGDQIILPNYTATSSMDATNTSIEELKNEGATAIIGVAHTGWMGIGSMEVSANDTNSWQIANNTADLDILIDGHTHSIINDGQGELVGEDPTLVNQAQCFGDCIGVMYVYLKDGKVLAVDGNVLIDMETIPADAEIQEMVDNALAKVKEDFGKPIGYTEYFLNGERIAAGNEGGTIRGNETNLGDLFTDVMLAALKEKTGLDLAFIAYPGFLLRASVEPGDITLETIQSVLGTGGFLYYAEYTAQDMVDLVSDSLAILYPDGEGVSFMHYSGLKATYIYNGGSGTLVTLTVGDTLIYDADNGGLQVGEDWSCLGVQNGMVEDKDDYDPEVIICDDLSETQEMVGDYFQTHEQGVDYVIYPNTVAPDGRVAPVE